MAKDDFDENGAGGQTDMVPQRCTDIFCAVIFFVFMGGMGYCAGYGYSHGNLKRLNHAYNWRGELCGVDDIVKDMPLLYFCGDTTQAYVPGSGVYSALNLKSPICVEKCPTDFSTTMTCKNPTKPTEVVSGGTDIQNHLDTLATHSIVLNESVAEQKSYASEPIMGKFCVPNTSALSSVAKVDMGALAESLINSTGPIGDAGEKVLDAFGSLKRIWPLFTCSAIAAIILGYAYLVLLKCCAKPLVYSILIGTILVFMISGAYFMMGYVLSGDALSSWEGNNPWYSEHFALEDAQLYSFICGCVLVAIGLVICLVLFCSKRSIDMAIGCVEAATDCLFSLPTLLLMPIFEATAKVIIILSCLTTLMYLVTAGEFITGTTIDLNGYQVGGLRREFEYTDFQKGMIVYYTFGFIWMLELVNAVGQFSVSYAVVSWYYTPLPKDHVQWCLTGRGAMYGLTMHLGTCAMGAFLIALCRALRAICEYLSGEAKSEGNQVVACIMACVAGCIHCIEKCIAFINKNAYIDCAINSNNFCMAARNAFEFITRESIAISLLNGACYVFVMAGTILISLGTSWSAYELITKVGRWTDQNSDQYISSPLFVAVLIALMAGFIAHSFMVVFDHTADTLLYTFCWNKDNGHNSVVRYAPPGLQKVVKFQKKEKPKAGPAPEKPGFWSSFFGSSKKHEENQPLVGHH